MSLTIVPVGGGVYLVAEHITAIKPLGQLDTLVSLVSGDAVPVRGCTPVQFIKLLTDAGKPPTMATAEAAYLRERGGL